MIDQAARLRDRIRERELEEANAIEPFRSRVIAITSGKGGVGKTNFAVNLAILLSKQSKRVFIIDADFGLSNIEVLFGILPKHNFSDVLQGNKSIEEIITNGPMGVKFISGGSGLTELANISDRQMSLIIGNMGYLDRYADIILIDTGAGISKSVTNFIKAAGETIIVTTPEPTSITDAYTVIKTIKEECKVIPHIQIIVNRVESMEEGIDVYDKLNRVSQRYLDLKLACLGVIPYDYNLVKAVKLQQPVSLSFPNTDATKAMSIIASKLTDNVEAVNGQGGFKSFIKRLVSMFGSN